MDFLSAVDVRGRLNPDEVMPALVDAFVGLTTGETVQPAQSTISLPNGGDCVVYPGAVTSAGTLGVKLSPYLPSRRATGLPPVTAYTLLFSSATGEPILLCDSLGLTAIRTAATSVLAVRELADEPQSLAVIGSGPLALAHLEYALRLRSWVSIRVASPGLLAQDSVSHSRRDAFTALAPEVKLGRDVRGAVDGADVVMLCTSAAAPVLQLEWLKNQVVVTSISTNTPGAHEIAPSDLGSFDVYCDYRATAPATAAEMIRALDEGLWTADAILGDLGELLTGAVTPPRIGRRYFRSTGLGIEDVAIAALLV